MISFWPSLSLLAFFLAIVLECRLLAGRATIPLRGFLGFFVYGCVGASLISILGQQVPYLQFAPETNAQGVSVMPAVWLTGPIVEELAKALPVIVLAFLTSAWRRLSIADLTLAGFASGAGFGFVESNLEVLANGKLPSFQHLLAFGYQTAETSGGDYTAYFAGHAVYPALVGLAAGVGLRLYPRRAASPWIPAALALLLVCFDHGMFNWNTLHPADGAGGFFLEAFRPLEGLYALTLHGWLETWLLPIGLLTAEFAEGRLCGKFLGRRADLVLPHERGQWVINEWGVALIRLRFGRAVFQQTLAFFRRRRAFAVATLEAHRNPANRILAQYTLLLEQRLLQERVMLVDPPPGALVPPRLILERNLKALAWRWRWVLGFVAMVFGLVSLLGAESAPVWLRAFLLGQAFTAGVVALGLGVALWRAYAFLRAPRLDPVACEGSAYADRQARVLLVAASLACAIAPAMALLLGWKALALGAAYLSGALAAWIGQGGNLYLAMALGAIAGSVEAEPPPVGAALRDEIDAGDARIRRMERQYQKKISLALPRPANENLDISPEELSRLIARLDAEREMQGRRKRALESAERQALEMRTADLGRAVEAVIEEFERLRAEFDAAEGEERRRLLAFGQGFNRYLGQIERELNSCDSLRQTLEDLWRPRKTREWALRIAQSVQNTPQPIVRTFLSDLEGFASEASGADAILLDDAIARIRGTAVSVPDTALPVAKLHPPADDSARIAEPVTGEAVAFEKTAPEVADETVADECPAKDVEAEPAFEISDDVTAVTQEDPLAPATVEREQDSAVHAPETQDPVTERQDGISEPQDRGVVLEAVNEALPEDVADGTLRPIAEAPPLPESEIAPDHDAQALKVDEDATHTEAGAAVEATDTAPAVVEAQTVEPPPELPEPAALGSEEIAPEEHGEVFENSTTLEGPLPQAEPAGVASAIAVEPSAPTESSTLVEAPALEEAETPVDVTVPSDVPPPDALFASHDAPHLASVTEEAAGEATQGEVAQGFAEATANPVPDAPRLETVTVVVPEPMPDGLTPQSVGARGEDEEFQQIFAKFLRVEVEARQAVDDARARGETPLQDIDPAKTISFGPVAPSLPPEIAELLRAELQGTDDPPYKDVTAVRESSGNAVPFPKPVPAPILPLDIIAPQNNAASGAGDDKLDLDVIFAKLRKVEAALVPDEPLRLSGPVNAEAAEAEPASDSLDPQLPPEAGEAILAEPVWREPPKLLMAPLLADPPALPNAEQVDATADLSPALQPETAVPQIASAPVEQPDAETPREPVAVEVTPAETQSSDTPAVADMDDRPSMGRGIGRGKFAKAGAEKKPQAPRAASAGLASFRPAKFYGSAKDEKAKPGEPASPVAGTNKGTSDAPAAQGHTVSVRSSKFYQSARVTATASKSAADAGTGDASSAAAGPPVLGEVLMEYFDKSGEAPPPMQTVDSETFQEVQGTGRLDTTGRGAAPWTYSGVPRRGDFAIRLKRGADRYVEFVPSNVTFGQTPRYYPRRVGVGTAQTYIPVEHLEYFDAGSRAWRPIKQ